MNRLQKLLATSLALVSLVMSAPSFAVGTPSVSGSINRDTSVDYFDFTITVTNISQTTLTAKEKDLFKDRIRVWLTDLSASTYIPFEGDPQNVEVPFTLRQKTELATSTGSNNLTTFTYTVRVSANATGGLKKLLSDHGSNKDVRLSVKYYEDLTEKSSLSTATISVSTAVVSDAPAAVATRKTHKALKVTWTAPENVTWSDSSQKAPTSISVLVIDKAASDLELPAYIYDSTAVTDSAAPDGTCVFNPNFAEGTSCINCSDSKAYLNATGLESMESAGYFIASASPTTGKVTVPGLENQKPYAVVAFYGPGGLNRSACVTGTPEENLTYSEVNGEDSATLSDPKCFIATAAYGSPLHADLAPLRWFRDQVLLRTSIGSEFVTWYYDNGPVGAAVVREHPALAAMVRAALWIPVGVLGLWMRICGDQPGLIVPFMAAAILFATAVARSRKPRKVL